MIKKILISCMVMLFLSSCSQHYYSKKRVDADKSGTEYIPASIDEPSAKVIIVGEGFDLYLIYQDDAYGKYTFISPNYHQLPAEKQSFNIPLPDDMKGEIVHSFNMKIKPHSLEFRIFDTNWMGKNDLCQITGIVFNPEPNKNYIFYIQKIDGNKCRLIEKEAVYKNGAYSYIDKEILKRTNK